MKIYKALLEIQRDIHSVGIGKTRVNAEQRFNFRGIDEALMAFAPLFSNHGVVLAPSFSDICITPRKTKSGSDTYNARLAGTFTFFFAEDGSSHTVGPIYGEANDGQDKAISKAESVSFRQMLFITFSVPHEPVIGGDPDMQGEEEEPPTYQDWREAMNERDTLEGLREVKKEMVTKFGDKMPSVLVQYYNDRLAAIKAAA